MNPTFQEAVYHVARTWSDDHQQIIGEAILDGTARPEAPLPVIELSADEAAMVDEALADVAAGHVISQSEMKNVFARYRA